jgi:hypothetical protein
LLVFAENYTDSLSGIDREQWTGYSRLLFSPVNLPDLEKLLTELVDDGGPEYPRR